MPIEQTEKRATFRQKSEWQKDDCLFCGGDATQEAVSGDIVIRCCAEEICMERANKLAVRGGGK